MNKRELRLQLPDVFCKCIPLSRSVVWKIESSEDSSLLDPLLIAQLCASRIRVSEKYMIEVKDEEFQKNVIRIIHSGWCVADSNDCSVYEPLIVDYLKIELKQLKQRNEDISKRAKEERIKRQNDELVDRSAIYLKQSFWFSRSISAHHSPLKAEFDDSDTSEMYESIYGHHSKCIDHTQYASTRFEVFAISSHGNRFAMHNTVDIGFGDRIPECDREVHWYVYGNYRYPNWEHMGADTSHVLLQRNLSYYSTSKQYKLILQFGYLALPVLQQVDHWLPLSLLFEIICYAAPFVNDCDDAIGDWNMRRFSRDLYLPNLLQFQRYLWLNSSEKVSEDGNKNNAQASCAVSDSSCLYYSKPLLPLLNTKCRRANTKRAFESIKNCLKNSVKFDASEYNSACWGKLWRLNGELYRDDFLCIRRISTLSHLKLAFFWERQVHSYNFKDTDISKSIKPLASHCLHASRQLLNFFTEVVPRYAKIEQAEDGVWYIFPMQIDLHIVDAKIDQFLLDNKWTLEKNPKELEAKSKKSENASKKSENASKRLKRCASRMPSP